MHVTFWWLTECNSVEYHLFCECMCKKMIKCFRSVDACWLFWRKSILDVVEVLLEMRMVSWRTRFLCSMFLVGSKVIFTLMELWRSHAWSVTKICYDFILNWFPFPSKCMQWNEVVACQLSWNGYYLWWLKSIVCGCHEEAEWPNSNGEDETLLKGEILVHLCWFENGKVDIEW